MKIKSGQIVSGKLQSYTIEKPIGHNSGMGDVFTAKDQRQNSVVLKFFQKRGDTFDKERQDRLIVEAQILKDLTISNNPYTVKYIDEAKSSIPDDFFLVIEFLDAFHIDDVVQKRRISEKETIDISIKIAQAIDGLHKRNAIHRDIKPQNIMIGKGNGTPILIDFGTAKMLQTQAGPGTIGFMSEGWTCEHQRLGEMTWIKPDCDLYALGRVMFYMVTGVPPKKMDKSRGSTISHLNLPFLTKQHTTILQQNCTSSFQNILEKLLDPDHQTYHTATQLIQDLKAVNSSNARPNHLGGTSTSKSQSQNAYITLSGTTIQLEESWPGGVLIGKQHDKNCHKSQKPLRCNTRSEGLTIPLGHSNCKCKGGHKNCELNPRHFLPEHHMRIWYNHNQKIWMVRTYNQNFGKAAIFRGNNWNVMDHDTPYALAHNDQIALLYVIPDHQIPIKFTFYNQ